MPPSGTFRSSGLNRREFLSYHQPGCKRLSRGTPSFRRTGAVSGDQDRKSYPVTRGKMARNWAHTRNKISLYINSLFVAVLPVSSEPVSAQIPCLSGKIQGNFANLAGLTELSENSVRKINELITNSLRIRTGNFGSVSGISIAITGKRICGSRNASTDLQLVQIGGTQPF